MSRWVPLVATTPSGKTLFVCRMCGRTSPTPDKECKEPPANTLAVSGSCALLEEMFLAAHLMEHGQFPVTYTIASKDLFILRWVDADYNPQYVYLRVVEKDSHEWAQALLKVIANGKATEQRTGALAEPTGSTD